MEHPEERYYKVNRFILSLSGLWPYQNVWNARLMRAIITLFMMSSVFVQLSSTLTSDITIEFVVDMIPTFLPVIGSLCHLYMRIPRINDLRELLERMWDDWTMEKTDHEIKIMHKHAEISRLLTLSFLLQVYIFAAGYITWIFTPEILDVILPMNESRPRIQPFKAEFFIDEKQYFYLIRIHICLILFIVPISYIASCTLFLAVTQHVCGMCDLLGYRAERLFCVVKDATRCNLIRETKISCGNIAVFVRLHYNVLEFIGIIQTYHTIPFLLDVIGIILTMSLTFMQILTISGDMERAVRSMSFISLQLFYLFIHNYMGQRITNMSSGIYNKVYNSMWYDAVVSDQQSLLLIMKRRSHPLILTACNFYVMSVQSFGMILQTAISYCMFIRQI